MKNDKKQEFKTVGLISMFVVIGLSALLLAPVWNDESGDSQTKALYRAEGLAYQILEGRKGSSRGPASVGSLNHLAQDSGNIGEDPWGRQYQFKFFNHVGNEQSKILVWSNGPNGEKDTEDTVIDSNRDNASPKFDGDDLGVIIVIK